MTKLFEYVRRRNLTPGACLRRLQVSDSTWRRYVANGWVVFRGLPVLTEKGWRAS